MSQATIFQSPMTLVGALLIQNQQETLVVFRAHFLALYLECKEVCQVCFQVAVFLLMLEMESDGVEVRVRVLEMKGIAHVGVTTVIYGARVTVINGCSIAMLVLLVLLFHWMLESQMVYHMTHHILPTHAVSEGAVAVR